MLEVKNLKIEFHDHNMPEQVVHDFSLQIHRGEIIGVVGESGSGKTMTALAIAGLLRRKDMTKEGHIFFQGKDLLDCSRRELRNIQGNEISIIFQEPMTSLNPVKPIGWQVEECLLLHTELTKEERKQKALSLLREVGLTDCERVYRAFPHQLSGGMRQRVMIAAAMICEPQLLIADEPTTALDVTIQAQIIALLKKINKERETAILFISHDLSLVKQLCHRVVVMQDGHIVESGTVEEIFQSPKDAYTKELIAAIPKFRRRKKGGNQQ